MKSQQITIVSEYPTLCTFLLSFFCGLVLLAPHLEAQDRLPDLIQLDIQPGFTSDEEVVLDKAAELLNTAFTDFDFIDEDFFKAEAYRLDPQAQRFLKFFECYPAVEPGMRQMLSGSGFQLRKKETVMLLQLIVLRVFQWAHPDGLYTLTIHPTAEPPGSDGSLLLGFVWNHHGYDPNVDCEPGVTTIDGKGSHDYGELEITINRHALKKGASVIAGTLLHELLHLLGHDHPATGELSVDYSNKWQINSISNNLRLFSEFTGETRTAGRSGVRSLYAAR